MRIQFFLLVVILLTGCGTTIRGLVSAPLPDEGWSKRDYYWQLKSEDFLINVGAANFRRVGETPRDTDLSIWIRINAAGGAVSIDPFQVTLTSDEAEELTPATVRGPYSISAGARMNLPRELECAGAGVYSLEGYGLPGKRLERGEAVAIDGKRCFGLDFRVDSSPNRSFILRIDGLQVGGTPVPPHEVRFVKAKYKIYFDPVHGTPDYVHVRPATDR